ncbi:MAG: hypothetical protein R8M11_09335 [Gallionella sp.]
MSRTIHIIEPTLTNQAGHCFSFVNSFCRSSGGASIQLWVSRNAELAFVDNGVRVQKYFCNKLRRLQGYFLYKKLLNGSDKIFISTASVTDLMLMKWSSAKVAPPGQVYFYFHWLNATPKKLRFLAKLAKIQPNFVLLGPTSSVINVFRKAGFENVLVVPYPISGLVENVGAGYDQFTGLLYAGAARQDKGISHVVDLLEHIEKLNLDIPVKLQNSPDYRGKYDEATMSDIDRLQNKPYSNLQLFTETLNAEEYSKLFTGAICIQLYDQASFADRISGVTLDALSAGSPIVTTEGTWIARMVQRFDAGKVIENTDPESTLAAIREIITDFPRYSENAYKGGVELKQENSADILFRSVAD